MLKKEVLLEGMQGERKEMLALVDIPNFTKCVAQFAGMSVKDIPDEVILQYLRLWARNKVRFFRMLGGKLSYTLPLEYENPDTNYIVHEFNLLEKEYPVWALWLRMFRGARQNKIERRDLGYTPIETISELFPNYHLDGSTVTHFFSQKLNAPEELITAIGRVFESKTVKGNWTLSIDPVDMMLASENPYSWKSCYRLTVPNDCSHADGCMAALLDTSSVISYIWTSEGKMQLYSYELKNIKYKKMRQWISISPNMTCLHFNKIYPSENVYGKELCKQLRAITEELVAAYNNMPNEWKLNSKKDANNRAMVERLHLYGYEEFEQEIYVNASVEQGDRWHVYNEEIPCPCGCGETLIGSDGYHVEYTGEGFNCNNLFLEEYDEDEWEGYEGLDAEDIFEVNYNHTIAGPGYISANDNNIQLEFRPTDGQAIGRISLPETPRFMVRESDITTIDNTTIEEMSLQEWLNRRDITVTATRDHSIRIDTMAEA